MTNGKSGTTDRAHLWRVLGWVMLALVLMGLALVME